MLPLRFYAYHPVELAPILYPIRFLYINIFPDREDFAIVIEDFFILDFSLSQTMFNTCSGEVHKLVRCGYVTKIRLHFHLPEDGYYFIQHSSSHIKVDNISCIIQVDNLMCKGLWQQLYKQQAPCWHIDCPPIIKWNDVWQMATHHPPQHLPKLCLYDGLWHLVPPESKHPNIHHHPKRHHLCSGVSSLRLCSHT